TSSNRYQTEESARPKKTQAAANARPRGKAARHQSAATRKQRIVVRLFQITARLPNSKISRPLRRNEHACGVHWILVKKNTYQPVIRVDSDATRVTTSMNAGALATGGVSAECFFCHYASCRLLLCYWLQPLACSCSSSWLSLKASGSVFKSRNAWKPSSVSWNPEPAGMRLCEAHKCAVCGCPALR